MLFLPTIINQMGISQSQARTWLSLLFLILTINLGFSSNQFVVPFRGGATSSSSSSSNNKSNEAFELLANALEGSFEDRIGSEKLEKALIKLASAQQTFKGLDGAAHEAYRRTRSSSVDVVDTSVTGRAQRSAARIAATAEALLACELVEIVENPDLVEEDTLIGREVIANITFNDKDAIPLWGSSSLSVLVLYEKSYDRGAGLDHGTIASLTDSNKRRKRYQPKGRLLIILGEHVSRDMAETLKILDQPPKHVKLASGLVVGEVASVQPTLYKSAGQLLDVLEPHFRKYNETAIHFVGRSLAGGVASLAATMLDGTLPLPVSKKGKRKSKKQPKKNGVALSDEFSTGSDPASNTTQAEPEPILEPLNGLGRARSSAMTIGPPPCLSSNVLAAFCTSILFGDDVVCRTSHDSLETLRSRIERNVNGGLIGRNLGWVSDTVSLTVSSLKTHAHGSEGEEIKLSTPGKAYLIRPRRLGGICSIHEVGNFNKGGREALRANLLWQLNDILLSKSMWKHHKLDEYIHGLDRVQLRGSVEADE